MLVSLSAMTPILPMLYFLLEDPASFSGPEKKIKIGYRYAYLCRESSKLLINFQVTLLRYGRRYLWDDSEQVQVSKNVSVENSVTFSYANILQNIAYLLVISVFVIFNNTIHVLEVVF